MRKDFLKKSRSDERRVCSRWRASRFKPLTRPLPEAGRGVPPSLAGKGGGLGHPVKPLSQPLPEAGRGVCSPSLAGKGLGVRFRPVSRPLSQPLPEAGRGVCSPSLAGKGVRGLGHPVKPLSRPLPDAGRGVPPSLAGKGVRGLGFLNGSAGVRFLPFSLWKANLPVRRTCRVFAGSRIRHTQEHCDTIGGRGG